MSGARMKGSEPEAAENLKVRFSPAAAEQLRRQTHRLAHDRDTLPEARKRLVALCGLLDSALESPVDGQIHVAAPYGSWAWLANQGERLQAWKSLAELIPQVSQGGE